MKTSVVLSAYNGEKYIQEQLESIEKQTISVDEVMIIDDGSTDSTIKICKTFIKTHNLSTWKIICNDKNQGFVHNFIHGAYLSKGDVIFFSDQDDIWVNDRVECFMKYFNSNMNILSLTTTFSRFSEDGRVLDSHVVHPNSKKDSLIKISLRNYCHFCSYLGMSMAIRRSLLFKYDFINFEKHISTHDIFFNYVAVINNGLYHLDKVLTKRRSYDSSTSNRNISNGIKLCNSKLHYKLLSDIDLKKTFYEMHIAAPYYQKYLKNNMKNEEKRLTYVVSTSIVDYIKQIVLLFTDLRLEYLKDFVRVFLLK